MKNIKNNFGFTIIELLVVVAIIGILAAIAIVNVARYIDRGKDAAAKGDLATLLTAAIAFYNEKGDFNGIAFDSDYANALSSLKSDRMKYDVVVRCGTPQGSETFCESNSNSVSWCASIQEKADKSLRYCVDSRGAKKESPTAICKAGICSD